MVVLSTMYYCRWHLLIYVIFLIVSAGQATKQLEDKEGYARPRTKESITSFPKNKNNDEEDEAEEDRRERSKVDQQDSSSPALNVFLENVLKARNELKWIDQAARSVNLDVSRTTSANSPSRAQAQDSSKPIASTAGASKESDFGHASRFPRKRGFAEYTNMAWLPQKMKQKEGGSRGGAPERVYLGREVNSKREVDRFDYNDVSRLRDRWKGNSIPASALKANRRRSNDFLDARGDRVDAINPRHLDSYLSTPNERKQDESQSFEYLKKAVLELKKNLTENEGKGRKGEKEGGSPGSRTKEGHVEETEGKKESQGRGERDRNLAGRKKQPEGSDNYLNEEPFDKESNWWEDPRGVEEIFDFRKHEDDEEDDDEESEESESDAWRMKRERGAGEKAVEDPKIFYSYGKETEAENSQGLDARNRRKSVENLPSLNEYTDDKREAAESLNEDERDKTRESFRSEKRKDGIAVRKAEPMTGFHSGIVSSREVTDGKERDARGKFSARSTADELREEGRKAQAVISNYNDLEKLINSETGRTKAAAAYNSENNPDAETKLSEEEKRPESGIEKNEKLLEARSRETDLNLDAAESGTMADGCEEELKRCNNGAAAAKHGGAVLSIDADRRQGSANCEDARRADAKLLMFDVCSSEKKIETEQAVRPNELVSTLLDIKVEKSRINSAGSDDLLREERLARKAGRALDAAQRRQEETERKRELDNFDNGRKKDSADEIAGNPLRGNNDSEERSYVESKRQNERGGEDEVGKFSRDTGRRLLSSSDSDKTREDDSEDEFPGGVIQYYDYEVHDQPENSAGAESEGKQAVQAGRAALRSKNVNEREAAANQSCPFAATNKKNENEEAVLKEEEERRKSNRTLPKEEFLVDLGESRPKNESEKTSAEQNLPGRGGNEVDGEPRDSRKEETPARNEGELKARAEARSDNETPRLEAEFAKREKGPFNDDKYSRQTSRHELKDGQEWRSSEENVRRSDETPAKDETKLQGGLKWKENGEKSYKDDAWPRESEASDGGKEKEAYKAEKEWPSERGRWVKEENELSRQAAQHENGETVRDMYHGKPVTDTRRWSGAKEHQQPFLERKKEFENDRESHIILIEPLENVLDAEAIGGLDSEGIGAFFGDIQPIRVFDRREQEASGNLYDDYDEQRHAAHYLLREENHNQPKEMLPLYEELKSVNDWPDQQVRGRTRIRGDRRMYDDSENDVGIKDSGKEVSENGRLEKRHRRYSSERNNKMYAAESGRDLNEAAAVAAAAAAADGHHLSRRKRSHRRGALSSSAYLLNYEGSAPGGFNGRAYLVISSEELPAFSPGNSSASNYLALKSTDDMFKGGGEQSNPIEEKSPDRSLAPNNTAEWKLAKVVEPDPVEGIPAPQVKVVENLPKSSEDSARLIDKREKSVESLNREEKDRVDSKDFSESFVESLDPMDELDGEARVRLGRGLKTIDEDSMMRANAASNEKIDAHDSQNQMSATTVDNLPATRNESKDTGPEDQKKESVSSAAFPNTERNMNKSENAIDKNPLSNQENSTEHSSIDPARAKTENPGTRREDIADTSRVKRQAGYDRSIREDPKSIGKRSIDYRSNSAENYADLAGRSGGGGSEEDGESDGATTRRKKRKHSSARKKSKSKRTGGKSKKRGRRSRRHREERVSAGSPAALKEYRMDSADSSSFLIAPGRRGEVVNAERVALKGFPAGSYDASVNADLKGPYGIIQGTVKLDDDTGRRNIAYLLTPDDTHDDSQMELALRGQLAGRIVDSIFEQVQKNAALKNALGPGLYRRHKPEDILSTDKSYREGLDEDEVKRTEAMMKKVMEILGRLVLNEVQRRTCSALPPDLRDFLDSIVGADREEGELADEDHAGLPYGHENEIPETGPGGKFLFNKTDEEISEDVGELYRKVRVLKKLIDEYNALTDIEKTRVQMVHDYLVRQVDLLLNYIEAKEKEEKRTASTNLGEARIKSQNLTRYNASGKNSTYGRYSTSRDALSLATNASTFPRVGNATFNFQGEHSRAAFRHAKLRKIRSSLGTAKKAHLGKHRKYRRRKPKHRKYRKHKREIKSEEEEKKRLKERSIVPEEYYRNDYDWLDLDKTVNFEPSEEEVSNQKEKRQVADTEKAKGKGEEDGGGGGGSYGSEKSKRNVLSTSAKLRSSTNPENDTMKGVEVRRGAGCSTSEGPFDLNEGKQDFAPIKGKSRVEDELILLNKREAWRRENEEQLEEVAFGEDMRNKVREKEEFEKLTNMDKVKADRNRRRKRENERMKNSPQKDNSVEATKKENVQPIVSENPFPQNNSRQHPDDSHENNLSSEERLKMFEAKINVYPDMENTTTVERKNQSISSDDDDDAASRFRPIVTNNTSNFSAATVGGGKRLAGNGFEKKAVYRYEFAEPLPPGELKSLRYYGFDNEDMMAPPKRRFYNYEGNYFAAYDEREEEARRGGHYFYPVSTYRDVFAPSLYFVPDVSLRYRRRRYPTSASYIEYDPFKSRLRPPCSVHARSLPAAAAAAGEIDDPF